ncbi:MAG: DUF1611 domain-containing protein, partial [Proteobacteria bacterium]|nr:DUF1611 domain-containing protein [Pseudomonadota bacterium]
MKQFKHAALLVEGAKDIFHAKTASVLLKYRPESISFLLDSTHSKSNPNIFSKNSDIPTITDVKNGLGKIDNLIICLMLPEGKVPESWINHITTALKNGIDIINPLHVDFGKLAQISNILGSVSTNSSEAVTKFNDCKGEIHNIRIPPDDIELFSLKVLKTHAKRVLTVGSDCNIGKMLTSLELNAVAKKRGINSDFIATGQIGMLIKGEGIAIDRVISDFVPGSVEKLILKEKNRDLLFVEGQGSIFQPIYSAVTMGLVHGTAPDAMIFCHVPSRKKLRYTDIDMPGYHTMIKMYEDLA